MRHEEQATSCVYAKHYNKDYYNRNRNEIRERNKDQYVLRKQILQKVSDHVAELSKLSIISDEVRLDLLEFMRVCCSVKSKKP